MVTDEQYKSLEKRVEALEKKINLLSQQLSAVYMKNDIEEIAEHAIADNRRKKDVTKYMFRDQKYTKRGLVLAVIKQYVLDKKITLSQDLLDAFPDYIQGSLGVIKNVLDAERYASANKRYFFADDEVIHLDDGVYAVCKQWDSQNIVRFLRCVESIGYTVEAIERSF